MLSSPQINHTNDRLDGTGQRTEPGYIPRITRTVRDYVTRAVNGESSRGVTWVPVSGASHHSRHRENTHESRRRTKRSLSARGRELRPQKCSVRVESTSSGYRLYAN